jgi:filamentous hemagglutinin family protein
MKYQNGAVAKDNDAVLAKSSVTGEVEAGRIHDLIEDKGTATLWVITPSGVRFHLSQKVDGMFLAETAFKAAKDTLKIAVDAPVKSE